MKYFKAYNSNYTNEILTSFGEKKIVQKGNSIKSVSGLSYIDVVDSNEFSQLSFNARKLFLAAIEEFSSNHSHLQYMSKNDLELIEKARVINIDVSKSDKRQRKAIKDAILNLEYKRLHITEKLEKKNKNRKIIEIVTGRSFSIIDSIKKETILISKNGISEYVENIPVKRGVITFNLSFDLCKILALSPIALIPEEIKNINNPISFYIGYSLAIYYNTQSIHNEKTKNIRTIKSLIEKCPDLPSVDEVKKNKKSNYSREIIIPFCRGIEQLQSVKIEICEKEENDFYPIDTDGLSYSEYFKKYSVHDFLELYIWFEFKEYNEQAIENYRNRQKKGTRNVEKGTQNVEKGTQNVE